VCNVFVPCKLISIKSLLLFNKKGTGTGTVTTAMNSARLPLFPCFQLHQISAIHQNPVYKFVQRVIETLNFAYIIRTKNSEGWRKNSSAAAANPQTLKFPISKNSSVT
jgi:hypothetical protein